MRMQIESLCGVMVKAPGAFDNPAIAAAADMSAPIPADATSNFNFRVSTFGGSFSNVYSSSLRAHF